MWVLGTVDLRFRLLYSFKDIKKYLTLAGKYAQKPVIGMALKFSIPAVEQVFHSLITR